MRMFMRAATILIAVALATFPAPSGASSGPEPAERAAPAAQERAQGLPFKISPEEFSAMSREDLAELGIGPGMSAPGYGRATATAEQAEGEEGPSIMSARGCNVAVCIEVIGTGLWVDRWRTTGYTSEPVCTFAAYWRNNRIIQTSNTVCGGAFTQFFSEWPGGRGRYAHGDQLCNTWVEIPGKPCILIKR